MSVTKPWPYNIDDKVKAIHFAIDPHCDYLNDRACPDHHMIVTVLEKAKIWESYRDE